MRTNGMVIIIVIVAIATILSISIWCNAMGKQEKPKVGQTSTFYFTNPCADNHEIAIGSNTEHDVDWGYDDCQWIFQGGFSAFNKSADIVIGFRKDGIIVWKYKDD